MVNHKTVGRRFREIMCRPLMSARPQAACTTYECTVPISLERAVKVSHDDAHPRIEIIVVVACSAFQCLPVRVAHQLNHDLQVQLIAVEVDLRSRGT